jgi:hypothetical protein
MNFKTGIFLSCLFVSLSLAAQDTISPASPIKENDLERLLEESGTEGGEYDNNTFLEKYDVLSEERININKATREQLEFIGLLDDQQIESILNYIKSFGAMKSLYELQGVYGIDRETMLSLVPYLSVIDEPEKQWSLKELFKKGKNSIFFRYNQYIEEPKGYTAPTETSTTRYTGNRSRMYARYRFQASTNLSLGITVEKDPGENIWSKDYRGFDYISGHFYFRNIGRIKALALGDYEVNMGQGLICYQGFGIGKGSAVTKLKKSGKILSPHTSVNEYLFFRGAGITVALDKKEKWQATVFGSFMGRDANVINLDTIDDPELISSLQITGYHRTASEIADRHSINQANAGGNIQWRGSKASVGLNALYTHLSKSLQSDGQPYNFYDFTGTDLVNASVDYSVLYNKVLLFGETAISQNGGFATLNTAVIKAMPGIDLSFAHRYYAKNYQTLFANAFGESSLPVNETGLYAGITLRPIKYVTVESYFDWYYFPWLRFNIDAPSSGLDIYTRVSIQPTRNFTFYVQGRYETKADNISNNDGPFDYPEPYKKGSLRAGWTYNASELISFRTRVESSWFKESGQKIQDGFFLSQDIVFRDKSDKFYAAGRIAMFRTDSYDTKIYAYESDVLYAFSIPAHYGRGMRWYAMFKYSPVRYLDLWVRVAQTVFTDREVISSGLDEIPGNRRTEVKFQVRVKW